MSGGYGFSQVGAIKPGATALTRTLYFPNSRATTDCKEEKGELTDGVARRQFEAAGTALDGLDPSVSGQYTILVVGDTPTSKALRQDSSGS
jgi:hypothetical protein